MGIGVGVSTGTGVGVRVAAEDGVNASAGVEMSMGMKVSETTNELDPLKGLTRLLTLGDNGRGFESRGSRSYSLREEIY